jgi:serine protease inhibitor
MVDALTRLVLVNAIYFKSTWASKFDPERTKDGPFFVSPKETVTVPMMTQTTGADYAESETLQILSMPYLNGISSMLVLLPKKTDGLKQLEDDLSAESLNQLREHAQWRKVEIFSPKFKVTKQFLLNSMLQAMGLPHFAQDGKQKQRPGKKLKEKRSHRGHRGTQRRGKAGRKRGEALRRSYLSAVFSSFLLCALCALCG